MGKLFGTDGIRGIAGQTLTAELAFHVGQAVAAVLTEEKGSRPLITIGKDTRISSDMLEAALMAGICSVGGDVMPLGTIPTPAVAFLTVQQQADAGIVISASHNPYAYNGIKVFNAQGYKLSDEMEQRVEDLILNHAELPAAVDGAVGRRHHGMHALHSAYVQHLLGSIDCDLTGLRVLVDCANGAASATAPDLFRALPLQADFIHTEPDGVNINNGCGSTHLESLARGVVSGGYDLGIAFDGDADRCLLVDEQGNTIDGDKVMAVCASELKRRGKLSGNTVVATVMSNLGLHEYCRENGLDLVCTAVGDRHVLERMLADGFAIGGLAVGEPTEVMYRIIEAVEPYMPAHKPRYLMGVGTPSNIIEGVARGVDFFDCVMPARNARHGKLFTWQGAMNIKNAKYKLDDRPIDPECDCPVCRRFSRAYVRHLFAAEEILALRLAVMHNLYFYNKLAQRIRDSLDAGCFEDFRREYSEKLSRRI